MFGNDSVIGRELQQLADMVFSVRRSFRWFVKLLSYDHFWRTIAWATNVEHTTYNQIYPCLSLLTAVVQLHSGFYNDIIVVGIERWNVHLYGCSTFTTTPDLRCVLTSEHIPGRTVDLEIAAVNVMGRMTFLGRCRLAPKVWAKYDVGSSAERGQCVYTVYVGG